MDPLLNWLRRESMAKIHTSGERTPPCGEPLVGKMVFLSSFISEWTTLFERREWYHLIMVGETPASAKALVELSKDKLSKAPEQSRLTMRV